MPQVLANLLQLLCDLNSYSDTLIAVECGPIEMHVTDNRAVLVMDARDNATEKLAVIKQLCVCEGLVGCTGTTGCCEQSL